MEQFRTVVEHALGFMEIRPAAAFDHVAGQRERTAGEADQRDCTCERLTDSRNGIEHVAQVHIGFGNHEVADFPLLAKRSLETRPFAFGKGQSKSHCIGDGEYVGEQDCGIEGKARQRLQSDFGCKVWVLAQVQKTACARPGPVVLGEIATGLTHDPDRRIRSRLAQQSADERIVLQLGHD